MPMARNRPFIRVAAATAAARVPPPVDHREGCELRGAGEDERGGRHRLERRENPAWRATTPKDIDRTKPTVA